MPHDAVLLSGRRLRKQQFTGTALYLRQWRLTALGAMQPIYVAQY